MQTPTSSYFDQAAATWDEQPLRVALMKAVVETILRQVQITPEMDLLDYGCGTGLITLFLAPLVRTVTAADSSEGMLEVLRQKADKAGIDSVKAIRLDLGQDPLPDERFDLIVASMVMHHVADTAGMLRKFHALLRPGGVLCISDLDTEPGIFHDTTAAATVHHFGFDRKEMSELLSRLRFQDIESTTAHTIRKPVPGGEERDFTVFLVTAKR